MLYRYVIDYLITIMWRQVRPRYCDFCPKTYFGVVTAMSKLYFYLNLPQNLDIVNYLIYIIIVLKIYRVNKYIY